MTKEPDETTPSQELLPLREVERRHILEVLSATQGSRTEAARILGLDRKTLYRKLLRYGIGSSNGRQGVGGQT